MFEGWCVGTPAEPAAALAEPVNALERDEDPDGTWRRFCNDALAFCPTASGVHPYPMLDLAEEDPEAAAARFSALNLLRRVKSPQAIVATCAQALLQPSPDPDRTEALSQTVAVGESPGLEAFVGWVCMHFPVSLKIEELQGMDDTAAGALVANKVKANRRAARWLERLAGVFLIAFGIRLGSN